MTNQTNTSGGANVDGNVNAGNDFVGRDKNIYYITVVGNLLSWAQVEGLIPKVEGHDFSSIAQAIEGSLNTRLNKDLADSVAFAGEILSDFVNESSIKYAGKPIPLGEFVIQLIDRIGRKLKQNGYWEAYTEIFRRNKHNQTVLRLHAVTMLYAQRISKPTLPFGIVYDQRAFNDYHLATGGVTEYTLCSPKEYNANELRIFITGIVLDLIRIHSDNRISVQLLQQVSNLFKAK